MFLQLGHGSIYFDFHGVRGGLEVSGFQVSVNDGFSSTAQIFGAILHVCPQGTTRDGEKNGNSSYAS